MTEMGFRAVARKVKACQRSTHMAQIVHFGVLWEVMRREKNMTMVGSWLIAGFSVLNMFETMKPLHNSNSQVDVVCLSSIWVFFKKFVYP